jgi:lipid A disaccharide synthetase
MKTALKPGRLDTVFSSGAVLYLGGDPFYTKRLAKRTGYDAYAYAERPLPGKFKNVFLRKDGDLMISKITQYTPPSPEEFQDTYKIDPTKPYCAFMAGSRAQHFEGLIPLYHEAVTHIHKTHPDFQAIVSISPFLDQSMEKRITTKYAQSPLNFIKAYSPLDLISHAQMAVTIPGTNTAECMYMGTPMVMTLPLNSPKTFPFDGLLGLLSKLPIVGILIKKLLIQIAIKTRPYFSLPNILAKEQIVPELIGKLSGEEIANFIMRTFNNRDSLRQQKKHFKTLIPEQDPATIIVKTILEIIK